MKTSIFSPWLILLLFLQGDDGLGVTYVGRIKNVARPFNCPPHPKGNKNDNKKYSPLKLDTQIHKRSIIQQALLVKEVSMS